MIRTISIFQPDDQPDKEAVVTANQASKAIHRKNCVSGIDDPTIPDFRYTYEGIRKMGGTLHQYTLRQG